MNVASVGRVTPQSKLQESYAAIQNTRLTAVQRTDNIFENKEQSNTLSAMRRPEP